MLTGLHRYEAGSLKVAVASMIEENAGLMRKGYALIGFQVVESERTLVTVYRRAQQSDAASSLVGE